MVNDALGEVLQERVHVGHVAQVADVVGDEVAGVAVKDLDGAPEPKFYFSATFTVM